MSAINCDIRINIEGVPLLHSDKELDAFLWEHRASFESLKDISIDKTFSLSLDEASEAQARLEESFKDSFEDVLKEVGCKYTLIGDQAKPSSLREAISTAFEATKEI
jgi:hypothetical protein